MSAHASIKAESEMLTFASAARDDFERSANAERAWLLYRGIKAILRCDEAEVVSGIARYVVSQHGSLRLLSSLIERTRETPLPATIALIGGLRSFLSVRPGEQSNGAVWIARLGNERRAIEPLTQLFPELSWTELKFQNHLDAATLSALTRSFRPTVRRILRLARRLNRRHEFFKVLRVVELICYYMRYLAIFQQSRFSLAVMSSHSNPHGIAFNLAARKACVASVLITHGMPVRPVAKLSYDLAVVHCEAARQTYVEEGCRMDRVLIHGRRERYAEMPKGALPRRLTVGIFLCKDVNESRLRALVKHLLADARMSRILIRPHPKNLWVGLDGWIERLNDSRVRRSSGGPVFLDVEASDIVLAGNSSVLVDAVTAGHPAGYVAGIDYGSEDMHGLVARGLIYPFDEELCLDADAMLRFYQRPDWSAILRLFANIDEDEASVAARAGVVMRELTLHSA